MKKNLIQEYKKAVWSDTKIRAYEELDDRYVVQWENFYEDFEVAWYWFCNYFHEGQGSDLYTDLSNSPYSPGPMMTLEKEPDTVQMLYYDIFDMIEVEGW